MKDKKLLKMLKAEVDSMTPNILPDIKNKEVTSQKRVTIINEKYSKSHRWFAVLASCMVIIVAVLCISVPLIMSHHDTDKGNIAAPTIDETKTSDDVEDDISK